MNQGRLFVDGELRYQGLRKSRDVSSFIGSRGVLAGHTISMPSNTTFISHQSGDAREAERVATSTTAALKGKAWKCVSCNEISRPWPDASVATVTTIQPDQRSHGAARAACITTASPRALSGV